ncbi:MAG: T9SS type A sorting domain-containing protein [Candidatus Cloacimonetes bacterium]|nr:T9SS type A sorting domain-containing protein [Candidatus Cloacimonadota bacterium]
MKTFSTLIMSLLVSVLAQAQSAWWTPAEPELGDAVTIYYDAVAGALPNGASNLILHWGVNETGPGGWETPPSNIWPAGTTVWVDGIAARTPMISQGNGVFSVQISPTVAITSIHFVVTDGTNWDSNANLNWNVYFGDPPVFADVWHRFIFDPASEFYSGDASITQVHLAGTFNNWSSSADNMLPGPAGTWILDKVIPEGFHQYKFVVNTGGWTWDPDNPVQNSNDNNNSVLELVPSTDPVFIGFDQPDNLVVSVPQTLALTASFRDPDTGAPIDWETVEVELDGDATMDYTVLANTLSVDLDLNTEGRHTLRIRLEDEEGDRTDVEYAAGYWSEGWHAVDPDNDDDGPGVWNYPTPFDGYADLQALHLWEAATGDTLRLGVELDLVHDYSRVVLMLTSDIQASKSGDHLAEELRTPDWAAGGMLVTLVAPGSTSLNPAEDNRFVLAHTPFTAGPAIDVWQEGNALYANLPMDILEEHLGSWQEEWYLAAYTVLDGVQPIEGGVLEITPTTGGLAENWDCDVYDLMNVGYALNEDRILANNNIARTSTLDGTDRGFAAILPGQVGPHMAAPGPVVNILTRGASTVVPFKTIAGTVTANAVGTVSLIHTTESGQTTLDLSINGNSWSTSLNLEDGLNTFQATAVDGEGEQGSSALMEYTLARNHAPRPVVDVSLHADGYIRLYGGNTMDMDGDISSWSWTAEAGNPEELVFTNAGSSIARIESLPTTPGEYRVRLTVNDAEGHSDWAIGQFAVENGAILPVGETGYPTWVRDAIVYEVYLRSFSSSQDLDGLTARLQEIADLGANCIWLMPIFEGPSDHGYAINDYYAIEADYGTQEDFDELVSAAHALGIRIVLDMVINHSSIDHAWMREAQEHGNYTQYKGYYDWNVDGTPAHYYDWDSLPNFNVSNADLKHDIFEMCRYWVEERGVDGYRCDVAWGPMERDAQYWNEWRREIRRKRPDLLLLAEASANDFTIYNNRFNLAYDWDLFHSVIQSFDTVTPSAMQDRISNLGFWQPDNALAFRFLENHDEDRLINVVGEASSRLAATLVMTAPGVPLIYSGQEVGETSPRGLINWNDALNLRPFYQHLCELRNEYPQFRTNRVDQRVNDTPSQVYSYARVGENPAAEGVILVALNQSDNSRTVGIELDPVAWGMDSGIWYATHLMNGTVIPFTNGLPTDVDLFLAPREGGIWLIADHSVQVEVAEPVVPVSQFSLDPAWPNPFNPDTVIPFAVPQAGPVQVAVYNLAGQQVALLVDGELAAGRHLVRWRADGLASGVYFVHARAGGEIRTQKITLLK